MVPVFPSLLAGSELGIGPGEAREARGGWGSAGRVSSVCQSPGLLQDFMKQMIVHRATSLRNYRVVRENKVKTIHLDIGHLRECGVRHTAVPLPVC